MFDVSFFELAVIGVVALLALGPERLPGAARTLGALLRRARSTWFNLRSELERELDAESMRKPFGDAQREIGQPFDLLGRSLRDVSQSLDPSRLTRKSGLLSDAPATGAAVAAMADHADTAEGLEVSELEPHAAAALGFEGTSRCDQQDPAQGPEPAIDAVGVDAHEAGTDDLAER